MEQVIVSQCNAAEELFSFFKKRECKKMLLVCDKVFPFLKIAKEFENCPVPYVMFQDFTSNPLYEDVCKGVKLFRENGCDGIAAIGGGSAMDTAKCIKLFSTLDPEKNYLQQELTENHIPLAAVPTTAGTGSESTRFAVIYYLGVKQSVSSPAAIPDLAVLDGNMLDTLPLYQKKCTMMDALCQGIESWWSVNSTKESRDISRQAVRMILDAKDSYLQNLPEGNEAMMKGANLAGQAIHITQTTAAHAMSYKLTSIFGLPHGRAAAVCLPYVWKYMWEHVEKCADPRGSRYLKEILSEISKETGCENPWEGPERMWKLYTKLFKEEKPEGFRMEEMDLLVRSVNPVRLKNNPVALSQEGIRSLYSAILQLQFRG